jgi:4,5-dihydroxyphthalate decarboxylase
MLSVACGASDRTRPILDGRIGVEGCEVIPFPLRPEEAFHRAFHFGEFAVSELSMGSYIARVAMGDTRYQAIPVFTSRMFRHSAIYVRSDSGIDKPEDLRGRIVGVPEYAMTAALWVRGFLADDYRIEPQDLRWRTGGLHEQGRTPKVDVEWPAGLDIAPIGLDETLDGLFTDGRISALISARPPRGFLNGNRPVRRLFVEHQVLERDYYKRTGIFPIMHVIAIRSDYVDKYPWLASSVFKAFRDAKALALSELEDESAPSVTLPWLNIKLAETRSLMGPDFWPYGVNPNRTTINAMLRYAYAHGTACRLLFADEIFLESTHEFSKE